MPNVHWRLSIGVDALGTSPRTTAHLYSLLQEVFPEVLIIPFAETHTPADIVFYDVVSDSPADPEILALYRSGGAALIPIADAAQALPGLRHATPLLLHHPVTPEGLAEIAEPLRNHLALRWLQRGMEELVPNTTRHGGSAKETSPILTFPTARGYQEWDARAIICFESQGESSLLQYEIGGVLSEKEVFMRLGAIESYLGECAMDNNFVRVHKSTVVHLLHIHSAAPTNGNASGKDLMLHLTGGRTCVCSRTYKSVFHEAMTRFAEQEGGSWKKQGGLWKRG